MPISIMITIDTDEAVDAETVRSNIHRAIHDLRNGGGLAPDASFGEIDTKVINAPQDVFDMSQAIRAQGCALAMFVEGDITAHSGEAAAAFLSEHRKYIEDAMITAGNHAIETFGGFADNDDEDGGAD